MTATEAINARSELTVPAVRAALRQWISEHPAELAPFRTLGHDLDEVYRQLAPLQRLLYDAGWIRMGWPPELGGIGGSPMLRALIPEELALAGYPTPFSFATQEVLGPAVARYASPQLAAEVVPKLIKGEEQWCQGFSEPDAGSDLGSLRLRAVDDGDHWRVNGEKVWTSFAHFASRCLLLARTGTIADGPRGITALLVDMDTPGITLRPLMTMAGDTEFCGLFFDDVVVPKTRTLGEVGGGWALTMYTLGLERSVAAWQRQIWMGWRLSELLATGNVQPAVAGEALELVYALRLLSRRTVTAFGRGELDLPATSLDKLLMSTAEQYLFDAAADAQPDDVLFGDGAAAQDWRRDWLHSKASSIYGGSVEIQRNIIAERLLGLPRG